MRKKYELTDITKKSRSGDTLYRIRALKDFYLVDGTLIKAGNFGGFVKGEENLSQNHSCWVGEYSIVCGNAKVLDDALVSGHAQILDNAVIKESSRVMGSAIVKGKAAITGHAKVSGCARIKDNAIIADFAMVFSDAVVSGNSIVCGSAIVKDKAAVIANSVVGGLLELSGSTIISKNKSSIFERIFNQKTYNICLYDFKIFENTKARIFPIHAPLDIASSIVEISDNEEIEGITINYKLFVKGVYYFRCFSILQDCQKKLLEKKIKSSVPITVAKKYKYIFMLLDYFQKETFAYTESYRLASNFVQKLIELSDTKETLAINSQKKYIEKIISNYILAQFIGILCFGLEMYDSSYISEFIDKTPYKYFEFLLDIINRAKVDISKYSISGIENINFAYNEEMVYAVERLCDFDSNWTKEMIDSLKNENGLELYLD